MTWTKAGATSLRGVTSKPGNSTVCFSTIAFRCSVKQQSAHGPITSQYSFPNTHEWRLLVRKLIWAASNPPHLEHFGFCGKLSGLFWLLPVEFHDPGSVGLGLCLCQYWIPPDNLSEYVWKRTFSLAFTWAVLGTQSLFFPEERWSSTSFGRRERWKHSLWGIVLGRCQSIRSTLSAIIGFALLQKSQKRPHQLVTRLICTGIPAIATLMGLHPATFSISLIRDILVYDR